jgi:exosortase/archaeosortase family protein
VSPVSWRRGLVMLALGSALIWLFNQCRLIALYAAFRYWRDGFDALHTVWGPLLMLAMVCAFFAWNLRRAS